MASRLSVIVNSTPIIALGNIGRIELLKDLFGEVVIPEAVRRAVTSKDDGAARRTASYLGLRVTGTLGVLVAAKQRGLIDRLAPCVNELQECVGFRLSETVARRALKAAGEL